MYPKLILVDLELDLERTWDFHYCPVDPTPDQSNLLLFIASLQLNYTKGNLISRVYRQLCVHAAFSLIGAIDIAVTVLYVSSINKLDGTRSRPWSQKHHVNMYLNLCSQHCSLQWLTVPKTVLWIYPYP
jgi:hypothetical protein